MARKYNSKIRFAAKQFTQTFVVKDKLPLSSKFPFQRERAK